MYHLLLTRQERAAIDWIGHRYSHGNDLYNLLCECEWNPKDVDWDSEWNITFIFSRAQVEKLRLIGSESNFQWTCFAPFLMENLNEFLFTSLYQHPQSHEIIT